MKKKKIIDHQEKFYNVTQALEVLGVSRPTLLKWLPKEMSPITGTGKIPMFSGKVMTCKKKGKTTLIRKSYLDKKVEKYIAGKSSSIL